MAKGSEPTAVPASGTDGNYLTVPKGGQVDGAREAWCGVVRRGAAFSGVGLACHGAVLRGAARRGAMLCFP